MIEKKNVLIAGGTGLIGNELATYLKAQDFHVSILSRKPDKIKQYKSFYWNPAKIEIDTKAFVNQDYLINLAGESIAGKYWTKKQKKKILLSRTMSVKTLAKGIKECEKKNLKIISASAIGFYGNRPNEVLTENSEPGSGFLSEVCQKWEKQADELFQNPIIIRIGIVLSKQGGFLPQIQKIIKTHLNIIFGNGMQKISWIHEEDLVKAIHSIMLNENPSKTYNLCSSKAVSIEYMQDSITKFANIRTLKIKIPGSVVKFIMGDFSDLFLSSQQVIPENLLTQGFNFSHPDLASAIKSLID